MQYASQLGQVNVSADMESRWSLDPSDWFFNRTIFKLLEAKWGPFILDHFAAHHNKHLKCYFSFHPDPQAEEIDGSFMVKSKTIYFPDIHPPRKNTLQDRTGGSEGSGTHSTSIDQSFSQKHQHSSATLWESPTHS